MMLPRGPDSTATARRRIELAATEKLARDVDALGYAIIAGSIRVTWRTPYEGKVEASAFPVADATPREDSDG